MSTLTVIRLFGRVKPVPYPSSSGLPLSHLSTPGRSREFISPTCRPSFSLIISKTRIQI